MPDVIDGLREQRGTLMAEMETLAKGGGFTAEQRSRFDDLERQVGELDGDIGRHERQAEREQRAAAARATNGNTGTAAEEQGAKPSGWSITNEPTIYGRQNKHSYFLDMARVETRTGAGDGGPGAALERLQRHAQELDVDLPKRREAHSRAASRAYEAAFMAGNRAERRAWARMERQGISPFERETRALSRVDGQGGYLVPPLWLIDELIPYLRAGRDFANLWRGLPLPAGTDSINIPRIMVGTATGPQVADGSNVSGRDMSDTFVNATVKTIAGQEDIALQLLDQSPASFDEIILEDLAADYNMQLSAQCMLGSNTQGQILGVWPGGVISTATGVYVANTNNTASQTWVNGGGTTYSPSNSVWQASGQLLSIIARTRLMAPTHHVWHPWLWFYLMTQVDQQGRPLVVPGTPNNLAYNQVAVDEDGPAVSGPVGWYMGLPVVLDPNVPTTFASSGAQPSIGTVSNGQFAAVPGSGVFTPMLVGRWNDCYLWEGETRTRALTEVLSGSLQVRFQLYNYVASMPNRYVAYSSVSTGGSTVAAANAPVSFGTLTQFSSTAANSVLNMTGQGF